MLARLEDSVLVVIDLQPTFMEPVWEKDRALARSAFMVRCAQAVGVPILATEQVPQKMGGTEPGLFSLLQQAWQPGEKAIGKSAFSCWGEPAFVKAFNKLSRSQVVLVGIETHICVNQTAHDLMDEDLDVIVCADAVSARTPGMHELGLRRMADEGAAIAHTESVVYEWMGSAKHEAFREVLKIVKGA